MNETTATQKSKGLDKFILAAACLLTAACILGAAIGIPYAHHNRDACMPAPIHYLVKVNENIWPDWIYATNYDEPKDRSIHFSGYWTFEAGSSPLSGFVWTYHANDYTFEDVNYTIIEIVRIAS
jgi:hypothetical protein